jgi:cytoskeletal protein CcmA (bactofilin family)
MALMPKKEVTMPNLSAAELGAPHTILGPEASFEGKLTFQGQVRIDGRFKGEIFTDDVVVIGKDAEVEATVSVGSLRLHGLLRGNVRATHSIELHPPARLLGDVETPSLTIHSGVIFEGHSKMENLEKPRPQILKHDNKSDAKPEDKKEAAKA